MALGSVSQARACKPPTEESQVNHTWLYSVPTGSLAVGGETDQTESNNQTIITRAQELQ